MVCTSVSIIHKGRVIMEYAGRTGYQAVVRSNQAVATQYQAVLGNEKGILLWQGDALLVVSKQVSRSFCC